MQRVCTYEPAFITTYTYVYVRTKTCTSLCIYVYTHTYVYIYIHIRLFMLVARMAGPDALAEGQAAAHEGASGKGAASQRVKQHGSFSMNLGPF